MARLVLLLAFALTLFPAQAAAAPHGALRFFAEPGPPPPSEDTILGGCHAQTLLETRGTHRCLAAGGLRGAFDVALTPDGRHLYAVSPESDAVVAFTRDDASGGLTPVPDGCVSHAGAAGCAPGRALDGADGVAVSPDGSQVYVAARTSDAVAVLQRDPVSGRLTQLAGAAGCIAAGAADGCAPGVGLDHAVGLAVTTTHVYVAGRASDSLASLVRGPSGALTQAGCLASAAAAECAHAPGLDGAFDVLVRGGSLYVAARVADAVTPFSLGADGLPAPLGPPHTGRGLDGATALAVSADGASLYAAAYGTDSLVHFARAGDGSLTRVECFGADAGCTPARGLAYADAVAVSPDGRNVYVAGGLYNGVAIFQRGEGGRLAQEPSPLERTWTEGCISWRGHAWNGGADLSRPDHGDHSCARALALWWPYSIVLSGDGRHVYVASQDSGSVTLLQRLAEHPGDASAPETALSGGPAGAVRTREASFEFTSPEAGVRFHCRVDGGEWHTCASPRTLSGLADGAHSFAVRAADAAGNADVSPPVHEWSVDATPPDTGLTGGPLTPTSARFGFISEPGARFQCRLDARAWTACAPPHTVERLRDGDHAFEVRAVDRLGNADATPAAYRWRVRTRPAATVLRAQGGRLRGRVDTGGRTATYWFEYGRARRTPAAVLPASAGRVTVSAHVGGARGRYRLVVRNSTARVKSRTQSFRAPRGRAFAVVASPLQRARSIRVLVRCSCVASARLGRERARGRSVLRLRTSRRGRVRIRVRVAGRTLHLPATLK